MASPAPAAEPAAAAPAPSPSDASLAKYADGDDDADYGDIEEGLESAEALPGSVSRSRFRISPTPWSVPGNW